VPRRFFDESAAMRKHNVVLFGYFVELGRIPCDITLCQNFVKVPCRFFDESAARRKFNVVFLAALSKFDKAAKKNREDNSPRFSVLFCLATSYLKNHNANRCKLIVFTFDAHDVGARHDAFCFKSNLRAAW
jgi:hypothetical protein